MEDQMAIASAATGELIEDKAGFDATAIKAVGRVFSAWKATAGESAKLSGVSERTWSRMKAENWVGALSLDQQLRASAIVGVYKGLHLYFSDELADKWVKMRNQGPLFQGKIPIEYMINGGLPAIMAVRDYIDALRGGA
jgi:uncharacterized protein (DUF2384 family)